MISIRDMEDAIEKLGAAGAEVCVHSSMKSFGEEVEGGSEGIIKAFLNKGCTVMVPTFSYDFLRNPVEPYMPERNGVDYADFDGSCDKNLIFDPGSKSISIESMGRLPKTVLDNPASIRGNHPINSFTAIGRNAERLVAAQNPREVYAPFQQLMDDDGRVLLMGVGLDRATIIHYAEQLAGRRLFIYWANDQNGKVIPIPGGGCSSGFDNFLPLLWEHEEARLGKSLWRCYRAKELVDICKKAIEENPRVTHCGDPGCRRCNDAVLGGPIIDFVY